MRQPTWDRYEVALLIEAYDNIRRGMGNKINILQELSNNLRKKATNEGKVIDETFRNLNGMQWQLGFIDCAFKRTGYGKHMPSKLFQEMVGLYLSDKSKFDEILYVAKCKINQPLEDVKNIIKGNQEDIMNKNKEKFIEWLNSKRKLKYSLELIINVMDECSDYAVVHKYSKYVFWNIESVKLFEIVSKKLLDDKIFRVLHKNVSQLFVKFQGYYIEFLDEIRCAEATEKTDNTVIVNNNLEDNKIEQLDERLIEIVEKNFMYGFRLGSPIELIKLKDYAEEMGLAIEKSDEEIEKLLRNIGVVINGKLHVVTDAIRKKLDSAIEEVFSEGNGIIYYESFMERYNESLNEMHIVSEDMLKEFLSKIRNNLVYAKNYVTKKEKSTEEISVASEILRVWGDEKVLSAEQISQRLPYIPLEKVRFYLSASKLFSWVSKGVYTQVDSLVVTEREVSDIIKFVNKECDENGFASLSNMPLGDIVEQNYELSENAILHSIFNKYLSNDFYLNGKIVTRGKSAVDISVLIAQFCKERDECTLDEVIDKVGELTGTKDRRIAYLVLYDVMIRVDEQKFVSDRLVNFDVEVIDGVIHSLIKDGYAAIKEIATFAAFPTCGQRWSHFLLESYCYRFSRKYNYRTNLFNGRNAGAIVDVSIEWDYKELLSRVVAQANIKLEKDTIGQYLFETGYMAKSKFNWLEGISKRAKQIREEKY